MIATNMVGGQEILHFLCHCNNSVYFQPMLFSQLLTDVHYRKLAVRGYVDIKINIPTVD